MGRNEWESALKLSTIWRMGDIRNLAVLNLSNDLDSVDKILLGQAYGLPNWLLAGCNELAEREKPITTPEIQRLGADKVARLCQLREAGIRASFIPATACHGSKCRSKTTDRFQRADERYNYDRDIRSLFSQELSGAESVGNTVVALGNAPLQSSCIDNDPTVSRILPSVRNEHFYMESIVFSVRCYQI